MSTAPEPLDLPTALRKYRSLGAAVKANDVEALKILVPSLNKPMDPDMASDLLWTAADKMTPETAKFLIGCGADIKASNADQDHPNGISVPFRAAESGNLPLLGWMLEAAHVTAKTVDPSGRSLLFRALMCRQLGVADLFLAQGADINQADFTQMTPLHYAAVEYQVASLIWLVRNGADPTPETREGTLASEIIPEKASLGPEWAPDAVYDFLENYRTAYLAGNAKSYPIPDEVIQEEALERGPDPTPAPAAAAPSRPKI